MKFNGSMIFNRFAFLGFFLGIALPAHAKYRVAFELELGNTDTVAPFMDYYEITDPNEISNAKDYLTPAQLNDYLETDVQLDALPIELKAQLLDGLVRPLLNPDMTEKIEFNPFSSILNTEVPAQSIFGSDRTVIKPQKIETPGFQPNEFGILVPQIENIETVPSAPKTFAERQAEFWETVQGRWRALPDWKKRASIDVNLLSKNTRANLFLSSVTNKLKLKEGINPSLRETLTLVDPGRDVRGSMEFRVYDDIHIHSNDDLLYHLKKMLILVKEDQFLENPNEETRIRFRSDLERNIDRFSVHFHISSTTQHKLQNEEMEMFEQMLRMMALREQDASRAAYSIASGFVAFVAPDHIEWRNHFLPLDQELKLATEFLEMSPQKRKQMYSEELAKFIKVKTQLKSKAIRIFAESSPEKFLDFITVMHSPDTVGFIQEIDEIIAADPALSKKMIDYVGTVASDDLGYSRAITTHFPKISRMVVTSNLSFEKRVEFANYSGNPNLFIELMNELEKSPKESLPVEQVYSLFEKSFKRKANIYLAPESFKILRDRISDDLLRQSSSLPVAYDRLFNEMRIGFGKNQAIFEPYIIGAMSSESLEGFLHIGRRIQTLSGPAGASLWHHFEEDLIEKIRTCNDQEYEQIFKFLSEHSFFIVHKAEVFGMMELRASSVAMRDELTKMRSVNLDCALTNLKKFSGRR